MVNILLVDDEVDIVEMLRDGLVLRGHLVDIALNADDALRLESERAHDVAVIDYVLPGKRGLTLLHELRRVNQFIRAIIISGQIDHDVLDAKTVEKELQEQLAVDLYLPKPVAVGTLAEAVRVVCESVSGKSVDWKHIADMALESKRIKTKDVTKLDKRLKKRRKGRQ